MQGRGSDGILSADRAVLRGLLRSALTGRSGCKKGLRTYHSKPLLLYEALEGVLVPGQPLLLNPKITSLRDQ
jgi:hypothetical protein